MPTLVIAFPVFDPIAISIGPIAIRWYALAYIGGIVLGWLYARAIIRKGHHAEVDSYSAFLEADRTTHTGLAGYLRDTGAKRVYCCGLATDYCVAWSALDARAAGFEAVLIEDASRAIDLNGSLAAAWEQLQGAGVVRAQAAVVLGGMV